MLGSSRTCRGTDARPDAGNAEWAAGMRPCQGETEPDDQWAAGLARRLGLGCPVGKGFRHFFRALMLRAALSNATTPVSASAEASVPPWPPPGRSDPMRIPSAVVVLRAASYVDDRATQAVGSHKECCRSMRRGSVDRIPSHGANRKRVQKWPFLRSRPNHRPS